MAQITRKDIKDYHDDQEQLKAWRLAERRRQEEAFLQRIKEEAADLGRQLEPTPRWMQAIKELRSEVLHTLATKSSRGGEAVTVAISLSDMPWWWRRKWNRLADGCRNSNAASSELAKGLLEGGLRHCLETILPVSYAYCHRTGSTRWELVIEFLPPKN